MSRIASRWGYLGPMGIGDIWGRWGYLGPMGISGADGDIWGRWGYLGPMGISGYLARKLLISATFLPVLDYGDVVYMSASATCLLPLASVYHCALRFITGCSRLTHHCELYSKAGMPSLGMRRTTHWMFLVYKAVLGLVPSFLCTLLQKTESRYALRSNDSLNFFTPRVRTESGKKAFSFSAPSTWNSLKTDLKIVSLEVFRSILKKDNLNLLSNVVVFKLPSYYCGPVSLEVFLSVLREELGESLEHCL